MELEVCLKVHHDCVILVVGTSAQLRSSRLRYAHSAGKVTKKYISNMVMAHDSILTRPRQSVGLHNGVDSAHRWRCTVMMKLEMCLEFHHDFVTLVVGRFRLAVQFQAAICTVCDTGRAM